MKLEFGSLTDQQPTGRHAVRPWIAETFPDAFTDWRCEVVALELERTFWEKALVEYAIKRCRDEGVPKPWCWSMDLYGAVNFYKKLGFNEAHKLEKHFFGRDCWLLGNVIQSGT